MTPLPASKKKLKELGLRLVAGSDDPADWELYGATMTFFDELQAVIVQGLRLLPWSTFLGREVELSIAGRAKTLDTLLQKLERSPQIGLANVRDVAGVRIVGDFTLGEQDLIASAIAGGFGCPDAKRIDRRAAPESGYRALHLALPVMGVLVEVQIRTRLQHLWAEVFEKLADQWGRQIRYGEPPDPEPPGSISGEGGHVTRAQVIDMLIAQSTTGLANLEVVQWAVPLLQAALDGRLDEESASIFRRMTVTQEHLPVLPEQLVRPENAPAVIGYLAETSAKLRITQETVLVQMLSMLTDSGQEEAPTTSSYAGEMRDS